MKMINRTNGENSEGHLLEKRRSSDSHRTTDGSLRKVLNQVSKKEYRNKTSVYRYKWKEKNM